MIVAPELREYFHRLGFLEPDPDPVTGCDDCLCLDRLRRTAREVRDLSAVSDTNVLLRRHHKAAH
jgi:hypothetical protein